MSLLVKIVCGSCDSEFVADPKTFGTLGLAGVPKKCPTCCDKRQGRAPEATVVSRRCLREFPAVAVHLPEKSFASFRAKDGDRPCLRAVIKGKDLPGWAGVSWSGRLDVYCLAETIPSVARVRVMEVTHATGQRRVERRKDRSRAIPFVSLSHPGQPVVEVEVEYDPTYTYMVLEETGEEPSAALVLVSVDYKTTLKGLGRQWRASLDASQALWAAELSNAARSGRFGVRGAVAVVDDDHPVETIQTGDVKSRRLYNFSNPKGLEI